MVVSRLGMKRKHIRTEWYLASILKRGMEFWRRECPDRLGNRSDLSLSGREFEDP
jgi:hypothetical protein